MTEGLRHDLRLCGIAAREIDDVVQEALARLLATPPDEVDNPRAWLRTVAVRLWRDAARREHWISPGGQDGLTSVLCPRLDPVESWERKDALEFLRARILGLDAPYRQIAHLKFDLGWTREETIAWLQRWRAIGWEEGRRLIRETNRRVRALAAELDAPQGRTRSARNAPNPTRQKNGVWTTPPPPLDRLSM